MIPCQFCQKETSNPKFCSIKCASQFNNKKKVRVCQVCNEPIGIGFSNKKYCDDCRTKNSTNYRDWSKVTIAEHFGKLKTFQAHARIRSLARAKFIKEKPEIKSCEHCGYNKHYEICHKKAISDFDKNTTSISTVNHVDNLIALCPNCHYEFDNPKEEKFLPFTLNF